MEAATKAKIEIIPRHLPDRLQQRPARCTTRTSPRGMPVVDAPFVVRGREARLVARPGAREVHGGRLETADGDVIVGFGYQDEPGKCTFADRAVVARRQGRRCGSRDPGGQRPADPAGEGPAARLLPPLGLGEDDRAGAAGQLPPDGDRRGRARAGSSPSTRAASSRPGLEARRGRLQHARRRRGQPLRGRLAGGKGTLWIDDLSSRRWRWSNVLRRDGCPFSVTIADGKTIYDEGRDFEPVADPKLGPDPLRGRVRVRARGPADPADGRTRASRTATRCG